MNTDGRDHPMTQARKESMPLLRTSPSSGHHIVKVEKATARFTSDKRRETSDGKVHTQGWKENRASHPKRRQSRL